MLEDLPIPGVRKPREGAAYSTSSAAPQHARRAPSARKAPAIQKIPPRANQKRIRWKVRTIAGLPFTAQRKNVVRPICIAT